MSELTPYFLFLDVETNGKIKDMKAPVDQVDAYPRITQFSWSVFDENRVFIKHVSEFILPDGWEIPDNDPFFIQNGMSTQKCRVLGKPIAQVMDQFISDALLCRFRIAHNIRFDVRIIRAEMFRLGITTEFESRKICTMASSTKFCGLYNRNRPKWPTLSELHEKLFGRVPQIQHDASADVDTLTQCFFALLDNGVISLEEKPAKQDLKKQFEGM